MPKRNRRSEKKAVKQEKKAPVTFTGKFSATQGGFGFVKTGKDEQDIFIPAKYTLDALDGDTVEGEIIRENKDFYNNKKDLGPVGKVTRLSARSREYVVAQLDTKHSARPLDKKLAESVKVTQVPKGVKPGEWVRLRLLNGGQEKPGSLKGAVEESYGTVGSIRADLMAVAKEYSMPRPYTEAENRAAAKIKPVEIEREDMTKLFTITIDPEDAHDFDDAISIRKLKDKDTYELGVHISDVAAFIRPGSKFDKAAHERAFSSYIPGMFRPMLPKELTSKISLRQDEISNAHSVMFTVDITTGRVISTRRVHSKIIVNARLSYADVQEYVDGVKGALKGRSSVFKHNIALFVEIFRKMRSNRARTEEFLAIDSPEIRVLCDDDTQEIKGIERRIQGEADQLVEEFMLAANSAVADEMIKRRIAGLFRIHPEPDPEKIAEFSAFCQTAFSFSTGDILSSRTACCHFLANVPDDHRKSVILSHFLRSLQRASYAEEPSVHYGLGKTRYSHFTSPIRRYSDLAVHQQLWNADTNARLRSKNTFASLGIEISAKEENNDNAYFAANDRLKIHYLASHGALENANMYEAVINKITTAGLVCDIEELGLYGFVPKENIRGGAFKRVRTKHKMKAGQGHAEFKVGDFVYLVLDSIDYVRGTAIFRPAV